MKLRLKPKYSYAVLAFMMTLILGLGAVPWAKVTVPVAHANSNVQNFPACMASCRAQAKACYASGQTGGCKKQQIACFASCQKSINSQGKGRK